MTIKYPEAEDMIVHYLRDKLIDPKGRITSVATENHTPGAGDTTITLTHSPLSHIDSITVDAVTKKIWEDFYISPGSSSSVVTFDTAFAGTETVAVNYGYIKAGNWVYPFLSNTTPNTRAKYPRIVIETVDDPVDYMGSGTSTMKAYPHLRIHTFCESEAITFNGETYGGRNAARRLCRYAFSQIKNNWRDDLSPVLFDFEVISGPVNNPLDEKYRIYRSMADIRLSILNEGETQ